jgi:carboxylesterase type B
MSTHLMLTMTGMINLLGDVCLSTRTYYGIRYAVAPTGDLRWRSPVPADEAQGRDPFKVINAVAPGPSCPQCFPAWLASAISSGADSLADLFPGADGLSNDLESSEDCLRFDVVTPLQPQSARLPVVVQIHGGGELVYPSISSASPFVSSRIHPR